MAHVYLDRTDDGRFSVRVMTGICGDKTKTFDTHGEAHGFALAKMGKRHGFIVDTTQMSAEQFAAHKAKQARLAQLVGAL